MKVEKDLHLMGDNGKLEQKLVDVVSPFEYVTIHPLAWVFLKQNFLKKHNG